MSEINPTDYKSITARHFFRDSQRVEADFSIWRDYYRPSKRYYCVHRVWCMDQENMKDVFESLKRFGTIRQNIRHCDLLH